MSSFLLATSNMSIRHGAILRRRCWLALHTQLFSSQPPKSEEGVSPLADNQEDEFRKQQEFVNVKLEPGEWDEARTDPLYRPPWNNRARIISEEDYANRPRVGFEEEFNSLHDAMVVLSWLDRQTQEKVYDSYLSMMEALREQNKKTSHDYIMRVLGQQFNITAARAAAVVQLLHNEDQIRKEHPEQKLYHGAQEYADAKIKDHISNAYNAYRETPPLAPFVEDPMGVDGSGDIDRRRHTRVDVDDIHDILDLTERAVVREEQEARLAIDGRIYEEDVDESQLEVKLSGHCRKLLSKHQEVKAAISAERPEIMTPPPDSGERRPRWKYVAQTINTREMKQKRQKSKRRVKNQNTINDTIVEHNGELRVASVTEAKATAWKPERNEMEFTFSNVKQAWLRRTLHGETEGWGRIKVQEVPEKEQAKDEEEHVGDAKEDEAAEDLGEKSVEEENKGGTVLETSSESDEGTEDADGEKSKDVSSSSSEEDDEGSSSSSSDDSDADSNETDPTEPEGEADPDKDGKD